MEYTGTFRGHQMIKVTIFLNISVKIIIIIISHFSLIFAFFLVKYRIVLPLQASGNHSNETT